MRITKMLVGTLGGAALMYLMDPEKGDQRRSQLRDQVNTFMSKATTKTEALIEQISDRAEGLAAETTRKLSTEAVSDDVLVARVRSAMGHILTNAQAVEVSANNGIVTLSGSVPSGELDALLKTVKGLHDVHGVDNRLEMYEDAAKLS